jgi:murein DD-endopeptidase MepM/ murein hydrolase activator NlpD
VSIERLGGAASPQSETEAASAQKREQIAIAAREFEAMFLLQMLKQMRQSMLSEEEAEPGLGASTMSDTIDVELSRHLAGQPGGLSDVIAKALGGSEALPPKGGNHEAAESGNREVGERGISMRSQLLEGRVTSEFGWRSDPLTGAARFHRGIDIAAAYGREVPAAADGIVQFAGTQGGYGNLVVLRHDNGSETRYAHLSHLDVREGDVVKGGDVVGRVGQTGRATGPHLHFELREDGRPVDPH